MFKKLGDHYGGFVAMDENTSQRSTLQWARVLVKSDEAKMPRVLQLVMGLLCFTILQLWWEIPPSLS